ncbi:MAG TPA: TonB family protein [Bryobacteraceae bacterium]|nr:TonB family protein [Bryobacteraceae bacterium]
MACLNESEFQGYLEESGATPLRQIVESHLVSCTQCRSAFDRVVETHSRVNGWLAELASPLDETPIDVEAALNSIMARIVANPVPSAEDHLARLLAPDTEVPWYRTIVANVRDFIRPEKLPPVELTSKPVEVKDIWGAGTSRKALASSVVLQGALVASLLLLGTNEQVRKAITNVVLVAPPPVTKPMAEIKHAGGGGQRSPLPPLKAELPKPAPRAFTPPLVTIQHPALTMDPSLVAAPDAWASPVGAIGNPLGVIGGGGGLGSGGGIGNGRGTGIGDGRGASFGSGVYTVGSGVTAPELVSKVEPEYSEEARKAKYGGSVMLSIIVNTDGKAEDIRVVKSLGMGLDEKAVEAVQKWVFKPGRSKGVPVKVRAQVEVNFRLL